jgi:hypothetical protein
MADPAYIKNMNAQINKAMNTKEMKASIADVVKQAITPEALKPLISYQVQTKLAGGTTEETFLKNVQDTNSAIVDVLKGEQQPVYVTGSSQTGQAAPNYLLYALLALAAILFLRKKVRL